MLSLKVPPPTHLHPLAAAQSRRSIRKTRESDVYLNIVSVSMSRVFVPVFRTIS